MGGHLSHEYHYVTSIGEQKLQTCLDCGESLIDSTENEVDKCPRCQTKNLKKESGIEVSAETELVFFLMKEKPKIFYSFPTSVLFKMTY